MIIEIEYFTVLVAFSKKYKLSEFRKAAKVKKGSYAGDLVDRIHRCLFVNTKDLVGEYEKYYKIEYSDFSMFLFWKYRIDLELAKDLGTSINKKTFVGYGRNTISMIADDTFKRVLENILSELGEKNENPN